MSVLPAARAPRAPYLKGAATAVLSVLAAAVMVACQPAVTPAAAQAPGAAASEPAVAVAVVQQRAVAAQHVHVGHVEAAQRVEIRPRVAGAIEAVLFRDGDVVRAGQPLFRIDPRPFDVALERARAELQLARSQEALARGEAARALRLAQEQAISEEAVERRQAAQAEAQARSAAAQAALQAAALDREFALVTAPVAGRIGRALVTAGNYVAAGAGPALATLAAVAPLHVYFEVGDHALLSQLSAQRKGRWSARIVDPQGGALLATAPVDFVDNEMAPATGTLRLRARIDQPGPGLVPGQFVQVRLSGAPAEALLVPDRAIATDQGRKFVLVVDAERKVSYRPVQPGALHGDERVIEAGLQAGEQVIVSGLPKLRPGMTVQPQPATAPGQAQAPAQPRT